MGRTHSGMKPPDFGIHYQMRHEICPLLNNLKIIFQAGAGGKNVSALHVEHSLSDFNLYDVYKCYFCATDY
jgi:hypothetical protein